MRRGESGQHTRQPHRRRRWGAVSPDHPCRTLRWDHMAAVAERLPVQLSPPVFAIVSVLVLMYGAIRVQDDAIRWSLGRVGVGTRQERVMDSLAPMAIQLAAILHRCDGIPDYSRPAWHIHRSTAGRPRHRRPGRSPRTAGYSHKHVRRV